jgi:uncharacterized cupredoxin-like copper-binding protein
MILTGIAALAVASQVVAQSARAAAPAVESAGHGTHVHAPAPKAKQQPWGVAGEVKAVKRTVEITMLDTMRFSPDKVEVAQGETVRFVLKNSGQLAHEMVIGTRKSLDEHAAEMMNMPGMEHEEPHSVHLEGGKSGEIIWRFNRAGDFEFACLIAGHYQAGMRGSIKVARAAVKGR